MSTQTLTITNTSTTQDVQDHLEYALESLWEDAHREYEDRTPQILIAYESFLWDGAPRAFAPEREVELPPRALIGSKGFKAWKAAHDAAQAHNRRVPHAVAWIRDYVDKHWPHQKEVVLALYR